MTLIAKVFMDRDKWLSRQEIIKTGADWDKFADYVLISSTIKEVPKDIMSHLRESHAKHADELFSIRIKDHDYRCGYMKIKDDIGRDVGIMQGMIDVSDKQQNLYLLSVIIGTPSLLVGGFLFFFFFRQIDGLERQLISKRNKLEDEIKERTTAENKLRRAGEEWEKTFAAIPDIVFLRYDGVKHGPYVSFSVSDTGEGMAPAIMEKIFDPFFTTKEPGKGTGLGLATVFGIIKQHNGHVHVYSEPGLGTTFKVYFPQVTDTMEKVVEQAAEPMARGTENILVVDDEKAIVDLIADTLKPLCYKITATTDPEKAVILHQKTKEKFDLLLTDVIMPKMNGCQLAETLLARQPDLKILYISGYTDDDLQGHFIKEQVFGIMIKPVLPRALAGKLRGMLDQKE